MKIYAIKPGVAKQECRNIGLMVACAFCHEVTEIRLPLKESRTRCAKCRAEILVDFAK
jgi:hypothetical protein